ncbi:WecB/TagA/CpsF family glycosyltransferase [Altererythrobacter sp. MTPC7]|uniref:WecB/TagA/CpsF family glycosyltransferase n=1 Tax=Altererythrobacter sp. MTPC7 TaxID=3056567 RepID=UPI0036F34CDA
MKFDPALGTANLYPEHGLAARLARGGEHRTTDLFGLPIACRTRSAMAQGIVAAASAGQRLTVSFANAHCINVAQRDAGYRRALEASDMILPDGSGMRIAARLAGRSFDDNLNGTDLFPEICKRASETGDPIFLLGGRPGIAMRAGATMVSANQGLRIAGTADGYFRAAEEDALIERIKASGARILFVGFGVPLQEKWIERLRSRIDVPVVLAVGGLFDYYSGRIARAPALVRAVGCEWAWRLAMEPRRLASRYLVGNAIFMGHALRHALNVRHVGDAVFAATKRCVDAVVAALALAMLAPLFLLAMLAIKLEDRGPVFFRQMRIGENGRPFAMLKLRSMYVDAEARRAALVSQSDRSGICFKIARDPRITRVGRILRRFSFDELPQLINVLRGDMSLVGPRPALASEVAAYRPNAYRRLRGKPGLTCIWQVSGRADIPFDRQLTMDVAYLRRRSLMADLALLARTVPAVLGGRGAY